MTVSKEAALQLEDGAQHGGKVALWIPQVKFHVKIANAFLKALAFGSMIPLGISSVVVVVLIALVWGLLIMSCMRFAACLPFCCARSTIVVLVSACNCIIAVLVYALRG